MSWDPDLYGPPEHGNEDPQQDDDWETLIESEWRETYLSQRQADWDRALTTDWEDDG